MTMMLKPPMQHAIAAPTSVSFKVYMLYTYIGRQYCFPLQVLYVIIAHSFPISACVAKDVCTVRQEEAPGCTSLGNHSQCRDTSVAVFLAGVRAYRLSLDAHLHVGL